VLALERSSRGVLVHRLGYLLGLNRVTGETVTLAVLHRLRHGPLNGAENPRASSR